MRHVATRHMWIQQKTNTGEIAIMKEKGEENEADVMTKHVSEGLMNKMMEKMGFVYKAGRSAIATRLK